jgi:hypothetical protein
LLAIKLKALIGVFIPKSLERTFFAIYSIQTQQMAPVKPIVKPKSQGRDSKQGIQREVRNGNISSSPSGAEKEGMDVTSGRAVAHMLKTVRMSVYSKCLKEEA